MHLSTMHISTMHTSIWHRPISTRVSLSVALLLCAAVTTSAQTDRTTRFLENCQRNNGDNEQYCEVRSLSLAAGAALNVDGRTNGGIIVHAWDKAAVQVIAMVQAQAQTQAAAGEIAKQISVTGNNGDVHASGPSTNGRNESWSVSYEVWAPPHTQLSLTSNNGGISVDGMDSRMDLETTNGGLTLTDVDGDVHGTTANGGVTVELSGDRWRGAGLDVRTQNGGVHLIVPSNYSAALETGTVNGGMDVGFPVTVQGSIGRRLSARLGSGGATIRVVTTNGGVSVRQK